MQFQKQTKRWEKIVETMNENQNILICGVGGQGTVLASKLISESALSNGQKVFAAETIGMSQRGGSVVSHVRIGENVFSPLIPLHGADLIIAFETSEAVRNISYLKDGGTVIVNKKILQSVTSSLSGVTFKIDEMETYLKSITPNVIFIDTETACKKLGSSKIVNTLLLGAACKAKLFSTEDIKNAIKKNVKKEFYELNIKALEYDEN